MILTMSNSRRTWSGAGVLSHGQRNPIVTAINITALTMTGNLCRSEPSHASSARSLAAGEALTCVLFLSLLMASLHERFGRQADLRDAQTSKHVEDIHDVLVLGLAVATQHNREFRRDGFLLQQPLLQFRKRHWNRV